VTEKLEKPVRNRPRFFFDLAFAVLCAFALSKGIQTTGGLTWPYDLDQFREIGMAQSILDGRYGTDHLYLGETVWYNPLTSTITAALAHFSGGPVSLVVTRAGAYLNLLAPISFYVLVLLLFERPTALAAGAAFLFAPIGDAPSWAAASYSPWLFSQNFAQGFFYLTLAAFSKTLRSTSSRWQFVCGALLGLTFLGHTAPAVLLGAIMLVGSVANSLRRTPRSFGSILRANELRGLLVIFVVAFVASLPFTFSILFHYHLKIRNAVPGNWIYAPLARNNFPALMATYLSWFGLVALIGFIYTLVTGSNRQRRVVLLTWLGVCLLVLAVGELQQIISPDLQLFFVPAHHFLFYFQALEDIFFGVGLVLACQVIVHAVVPRILAALRRPTPFDRSQMAELATVAIAVACFVAIMLPSYFRRFDFTTARDQAIGFQERTEYLQAYRWILANTKPTDVFLSLTGDLDLSIVGPADRKTLVTCQPEFSNPYVDWKSRSLTASSIVEKLADAAPDAAAMLAENKVGYIISWPIGGLELERLPFLSKQFAEGNIAIYKLNRD
jgi:hypothetical protein